MRIHSVLISTTTVLALAAGTLAQTAPNREKTYQPPSKQHDTTPDRRPGLNDSKHMPGDSATRTHGRFELLPSSSAIGSSVYGSDGEKIGDVNDLVVSRNNGRILYALVGRGGVLGVGEKVVAVPFSTLAWNSQKKELTLPITREKMKEAPTIDGKEWASLNEPAKCESTCTYFKAPKDVANPDDDAFRSDVRTSLPVEERPLLRLTDVRGKQLLTEDGRDIGRVEEVMYDAGTGRIAFAVVTFSGSEDKVAVPWTMLDVNRDGKPIAVEFDKERVRTAPRLTSRDWSELRDQDFASRVYGHYGKRADWLERHSSADTDNYNRNNNLNNNKLATAGWPDADRAYKDGKDYEITGTIKSIETVTTPQGGTAIMCVSLHGENGETLPVQLAPQSYIDSEKVVLQDGDRVTVHGWLVERDGMNYLFATEITPANGRSVTLRNNDGSRKWRR